MIEISLSPSSLNTFRMSEFLFYLVYIEKALPDTEVVECYGQAGSVMHIALEEYAKSKKDILETFNEEWEKFGLDRKVGMNRKPLSKAIYFEACKRGKKILDEMPEYKVEEKIKFVYRSDENFEFYVTGVIDVQVLEDGTINVLDWKSSSNIDEGDGFRLQGQHYAWLLWRHKGVLPKKITFEYLKIGKQKTYDVIEEDLIKYEKELNTYIDAISSKGMKRENYALGDINSIFNAYKKACLKEKERRNKEYEIVCTINKNLITISPPPEKLVEFLKKRYSFFVEGAQFSNLYKKRIWDGMKYLYKRDSIPLAYINDFKKVVEDYNIYFNKQVKLTFIDKRDEDIKNYKANKKYDVNIELRDYQKEAVDEAVKQKFGILNLATSAGKTFILAEFARRVDNRCLVLVSRIQLARQTRDEIEKYLNTKVGLMIEGQLEINNTITVASIQTIVAILKRAKNNEDRKKLLVYLYNCNSVIFDECHLVSDSSWYSVLNKYLINITSSIGMTGTAWRGAGDTLLMNSFCGFVIYIKNSKELQDEGFISESLCLYIKQHEQPIITQDLSGDMYEDIYKFYIVNNKHRNNLIASICETLRNKKILIITSRIEHAKKLRDLIHNSFMIIGETSKEDRDDVFKLFSTSSGGVIVGSAQIMSTGINLPLLDVIIYASAAKSDITTIQTIGRVLRKAEGKSCGYFIDFNDEGMFKANTKQRKSILREFGHKIVDTTAEEIVKFIY